MLIGVDFYVQVHVTFTGDKSKKPTRSQKPPTSDSELNKEELENLDCTLIEELSFVVKVKGESDPAIRREIKELKYVPVNVFIFTKLENVCAAIIQKIKDALT